MISLFVFNDNIKRVIGLVFAAKQAFTLGIDGEMIACRNAFQRDCREASQFQHWQLADTANEQGGKVNKTDNFHGGSFCKERGVNADCQRETSDGAETTMGTVFSIRACIN